MNSHILSKFAICAATFVINGLMLAGVNFLFNSQTQQRTDWVSRAPAEGASKTVDHPSVLMAGGPISGTLL